MKNQRITVNGIEFKSIRECADYFSVKFSTFYKHYKAGEKTELIIAKYSNKVKYTDYQGNEYHNLSEMLKVYNIPLKTYYSRKRLKWDLKRILTTKVKQFEYDGIQYHSLLDFCKRNRLSEKLPDASSRAVMERRPARAPCPARAPDESNKKRANRLHFVSS